VAIPAASRTSIAHACAVGWSHRRLSRPSARSAGVGAGAGAARRRTTCTSRRQDTDRLISNRSRDRVALCGQPEPIGDSRRRTLLISWAMIGAVTSDAGYRQTTAELRRFFYAVSVLVLAVGTVLFVGSTHTAHYFAWPIKSP